MSHDAGSSRARSRQGFASGSTGPIGSTGATRLLADAAVGGIAIFVVVAAALPYRQAPDYSQLHDAVSVLVLGQDGWLQTVAFYALGLGTIAAALALRRSIPTRTPAGMLLVAGLLSFIAAAFPTVRADEPVTATAIVHNLAGLLTFLLTITAMLLYRRAFAVAPGWQPLARPSLILAVASFISLAVAFGIPSWFGLLERLMLAAQLAWIILAGRRARTLHP